jgi:Ca-activated chloride channel homolog
VKALSIILFSLIITSPLFSQYYLRGEVKDETNRPLANAKILLHSTGYIYYSGNAGGFGIVCNKPVDSATISVEGFQTTSVRLQASNYHYVMMKMLVTAASVQKNRLISFTKNLKPQDRANWSHGAETYSNLLENEFLPARKFPETGFSMNIDKASYSNMRRFIHMNSPVPPDAVRIEEMLNYFNFQYTAPPADSVFTYESYLSSCPWNLDNQLLFLKVCAKKVNFDSVPPSNLVFLVDVSGSMDMPNRLPLLKSAFKLMINNLREQDTISIVVYGSTVGVWMQPTSGKEKQRIEKAIEDLYPGGATPGASGIISAYRLAKSKFIPGGNNRVILATDGDFNIGQTSEDDLVKIITEHRESGIYLTCLGVGMGNYKDSKLEALAKKGNGNFAYLDDEKEAEKVLVKELTQTLYSVADDAYLNINFNPRFVKEYRLIGFDNKLNAVADSSSELEGGEIGSGHTLMAMIEITPVPGVFDEMYHRGNMIADFTLHYKLPKDTINQRSFYKCPATFTEFEELPPCYRFASSVVMFASLLKQSKYAKTIGWSDAIILANQSAEKNNSLQKEFVELIEKARKIYSRERKRKLAGND